MTTFSLDAIEQQDADLFIAEHRPKCLVRTVAQFSYIFTVCSIGTGVAVRCSCGVVKDVTNFDGW